MEKLLALIVVFFGCADERADGPTLGRGDADAGAVDVWTGPDLAPPADSFARFFDLSPDVVMVAGPEVGPEVTQVKTDAAGSVGACPEMPAGAYSDLGICRTIATDAGAVECKRFAAVGGGPELPGPCARLRALVDGAVATFLGIYVADCAQCAGVRL